MPPVACSIPLPYYGDTFPIVSMAQMTKYPIVSGADIRYDFGVEKGYVHIVKIIIDPPFIRVGAIPGCNVDRKWITQAVSPMVWAGVCTIIPRICTNRNISASIRFLRSIRQCVFLSMLYG